MELPAIVKQELSSEAYELISYRPHWLIRRGNIIFLFLTFMLLSITWFIQYPDIVNGSIRIVSIDGPKSVTTKVEGNLAKLLVKNEERVIKGQHLAFIESIAKHEEVVDLQYWVSKMEALTFQDSLEVILRMPFANYKNLGELQSEFESFRVQLLETMQILKSGYYRNKSALINTDLIYLNRLKTNLKNQNKILEDEYNIQVTDFNAKNRLANEKVIAALELNQEKSKLLLKEYNLEQMSAQLINSDLSSHNKLKELLDLQKLVSDQKVNFFAALLNLKSKIEEWFRRYVLVAPQDGIVFFTNFFQENQLLLNNTELFYIQPLTTSYYGSLTAGQNGIGNIFTGQDVLIRLQGYPSEQYGYIKGSISYISYIPNQNDSFLIKVELPDGLVTNQKKKLYFRNNLLGKGEIIIENKRLIERFGGKLYDMIQRK